MEAFESYSATSKVLEKLMKRQMNEFFAEFNLLREFQSGFRRNHSTALLKITVDDDVLR